MIQAELHYFLAIDQIMRIRTGTFFFELGSIEYAQRHANLSKNSTDGLNQHLLALGLVDRGAEWGRTGYYLRVELLNM